jgi:hypothetical protein
VADERGEKTEIKILWGLILWQKHLKPGSK